MTRGAETHMRASPHLFSICEMRSFVLCFLRALLAEGADVQSALEAGIDHFIEKPVKVRLLLALPLS